jgi:hypothetical protein
MTDLIVLTKDTPKVAVGQKDGTRTMTTDQRRLLTIMGKNAGNRQLFACTAIACFAFQAINSALAWAESARFENLA